jgi:Protein of unknown function (DUF3099)
MNSGDRCSALRPIPLGAALGGYGDGMRRARRTYLITMGVCVTLIVLSWTVVRLVSTPAAIIMSLIALPIPVIAAIVADRGDTPGDDRPP